MVGMFSTSLGLSQAIGIMAVTAYATMAFAAFLLPETKGKVLSA